MTWSQARLSCERKYPQNYSTLASVPNKETAQFIMTMMANGSKMWIGGNDLVENVNWVWTDGSPWNNIDEFCSWVNLSNYENPNINVLRLIEFFGKDYLTYPTIYFLGLKTNLFF